ncbi:hypothetical protein BC940DRAFT_308904 [Gongronella butleri]|nr:hypothetical protein BC940DRAFT_308904 [Gongronella butleri]
MSNVVHSKDSRVVSFDTMSNVDLPSYCFTLRRKTPGFARTRRSRTFMVATDLESYSEYALNWTVSEIMDDGDELVVLRVVTLEMSEKRNVIQAQLAYEAKQAKEKAMQVVERVLTAGGPEVKFSVVIEFVIGKVHETIQQMISLYQPSLLIVGTRGISEFKGMFINSISKYCLQHSPVPVTVVRPEGAKQAAAAKKAKKSNRLSAIMMRRGGGKDEAAAAASSSSSLSSSSTIAPSPSSSSPSTPTPPARPSLQKRFSHLTLLNRSRSPSPAKHAKQANKKVDA